MIPVTCYRGKRVAVFGLGGSGIVTAEALIAGGANVIAWDDTEASREAAAARDIPVVDWRDTEFGAYSALVLSPGVPLTHPKPHWSVEIAKAAGVEVIGDIELFARERRAVAPKSQFVAITGTNGKSTTTALIAHILATAGKDVQLGGNIGRAVLSLEPFSPEKVYVVECSSFQIELAPSVDPTVAVHLNISEDHLDRHGTIEAYAAVKERLVKNAGVAVVGIDDAWSRAMAERREEMGLEVKRISTHESVKHGVWAIAGRLTEPHGLAQMVVSEMSRHPVLKGVHNAQNAAAAVAAVRSLGLGLDEVRAGLMSFPGLVHRMEPIGRIGRVTIVNDSKATNADAAARALASFERIFWIAGGKPKTGGINGLSAYFPRIAKAYLIGEAAESFAATLEGKVPHDLSGTLEEAVPAAIAEALATSEATRQDTVVLLSPACASFDQFKNFEERGDRFRSLALSYPSVTPFA
ncbi:UDP-N-acetylmuramoyl-L-alanine--D-glutamate ligase [Chthonobacter rhizosphaerae]|uniref:UDP-N-acetylmuramoyl-L-alanine--D-glutamate ligase n=1 Tax=Chthonobacter rhizosphaerae TaxID=2735553 RepID=UPI0015EF80B6|nr:UDP-N-acetylmuramoyl-L-alanine--D-glutamate ligase [Chthonobacter rhizosphaerae]